MFSKSTLLVTVICMILFFAACGPDKSGMSEYGPVVEKVFREESGAFRGFNLGDKMDSVQAGELSQPIEVDDGYLYYEYKIDDTTGSYNISYDFDENGLNEIQSDIYITNPANTEAVFNSFKIYLDEHYGSSETAMGYFVWSIHSENFGDIKINLKDESVELTVDGGPGKIALWIYPDKK
ncbi:MAG: hypothetical protein M3R27_04810 [Bacteroidota bacterium]|nr:hypothetical protein [Bacteroidota bacterium]